MTVEKPGRRDLERIDALKGHERTDPYHMAQLREEILEDGYQRYPITIDTRTNVILDGHHRAEIFKALSLSLIAVHRVDYDSPDIVVRAWLPAVNVEPQTVASELRLNNEASSASSKEEITLVWNEGERRLPRTREQVMNSVVGKFPITYARDEREAKALIRSGKAKAFLVFPAVTKEEVIRSALSGNKLPPKTTRHIFASRPRPVFVPLHDLALRV
jgi:hypothetical protein